MTYHVLTLLLVWNALTVAFCYDSHGDREKTALLQPVPHKHFLRSKDLRAARTTLTHPALQLGGAGMPCTRCEEISRLVSGIANATGGEHRMESMVTNYIESKRLTDHNVSVGVANTYVPLAIAVLQDPKYNATDFCKRAGCIPQTSPTLPARTRALPNITRTPTFGNATGKFLQLNDIHLELDWLDYGNIHCGEPICCRIKNGLGNSTADRASPLGNHKCDTPPNHFEALLKAAASHGPYDFIVLAGDFASNEIWDQSHAAIQAAVQAVAWNVSSAFPGVPLFHALGNHDAYPVNERQGGGAADAWINGYAADLWSPWIDAAAQQELTQHGYYTTLIRPGLRFIMFNTDYTSDENIWIYLYNETYDFGGQFAWLRGVLASARNASERVIVTAHEPVYDQNADSLAAFQTLMVEYQDVLVAVLSGHIHTDAFTSCGGVLSYINPASTVVSGYNSGFRVYSYDARFNIVSYDQYTADLDASIQRGYLRWDLSYSPLTTFQMPDLTPSSWADLASRMYTNRTMFDQWYYYHNTRTDQGPCDDGCRRDYLCSMVTCSYYPNCPFA